MYLLDSQTLTVKIDCNLISRRSPEPVSRLLSRSHNLSKSGNNYRACAGGYPLIPAAYLPHKGRHQNTPKTCGLWRPGVAHCM